MLMVEIQVATKPVLSLWLIAILKQFYMREGNLPLATLEMGIRYMRERFCCVWSTLYESFRPETDWLADNIGITK